MELVMPLLISIYLTQIFITAFMALVTKEATEDKMAEMVGWHRQLNGHEFEQTPGHSEGQRDLVCCSPWGLKESGN